ncbi:hypothetical protein SCUP515_05033 [Seiridium cupressi]
MSGEEMEISTDLGHHALGEDIDIDLEFAVGQHDEDLELGDYNQAEEFQHFNSDNRDELMAEDDNAPYGMADADDINYDETAVAAADYDIIIGDTDGYPWQGDDALNNQEEDIPADWEQNASHFNAEDHESSLAHVNLTGSPPQAQPPVLESLVRDQLEEVPEPFQAVGETVDGGRVAGVDANVDATANQESETMSNKVVEGDAAARDKTPADADQHLVSLDILQTGEQTGLEDSHRVGEPGLATRDSESSDPAGRLGVDENHAKSLEGEEDENHAKSLEDEEDEIGYDQEDEEGVTEEGFTSITDTNIELNDPGKVVDQAIATGEDEVLAAGYNDFTADEYQLGDDSFGNVEEHSVQDPGEQGIEEAEPGQQHGSPVLSSHGDFTNVEGDGSEDRDRDGTDAGNVAEDMSLIASRHTMVVHYGETDYRLFANEPEDDPSEYFFKDLSGLDLPLADFLSGIRSVISEEVSPLDELVLHIDGLGLEFGESMTRQVLDEYTFGHILSLYDTLVQNDTAGEVVDAPELYMYLMVRPNCLQRLKALQVQAASGRSMTDVAVYRDASPAPENGTGDGFEALTVTPDYNEEEFYDNQGQSDEEHLSREHSADETGLSASQEIQVSQHDGDDNDEEGPEDTEALSGDQIEDAVEDVVDYDNLDLSPSQQGNTPYSFSFPIPPYCTGMVECQCDTCWLQRVEADFAPPSSLHHKRPAILSFLSGTSSDSAPLQDANRIGLEVHPETYFKHGPSNANGCHFEDQANTTTNDPTTAVETTLDGDHSPTNARDAVPAIGEQPEFPPSEATSATVTLDEDQNDEIDYDENDFGVSRDVREAFDAAAAPSTKLAAPVDEEISWESENEEARNEQPIASKPSEQVSTTPAKRTRSGSDITAITGDRKDVKRQRS